MQKMNRKTGIHTSFIADTVEACLYDSGPNICVENPKEAKMQVWVRIKNKAFLTSMEISRVNKSICKPGRSVSVAAAMNPVMPFGHEPYIAIVTMVDDLKPEYTYNE